MDTLLTYWQEIISLMIVFVTMIILLRSMINKRRYKTECSTCALVEMQSKKQTTAQP